MQLWFSFADIETEFGQAWPIRLMAKGDLKINGSRKLSVLHYGHCMEWSSTIAQVLIGEGCSIRLNDFSCINNRRKSSVFESFFICFRLITITLFRLIDLLERKM